MPLKLREFVSSEEFQKNFSNADCLYKTLLCFGLKTDNRQLWNLWGFAYNNLRGEHAEHLVLKELQQYVNVNIPNPEAKFKVSFYISYSPCYSCCKEISEFISKNGNNIELDINCAKVYKWNDENIPVGLKRLAKHGISIKIMDKPDYEEGFYLFVDPHDSFVPWSGSELISKKYTEWLRVQLTEGENNYNGTNVNETNAQPSGVRTGEPEHTASLEMEAAQEDRRWGNTGAGNPREGGAPQENGAEELKSKDAGAGILKATLETGYVAPLSPCETDDEGERTPSRNPECTQLAKREGDSGPETPQKPSPAGDRARPTAGVKRKLLLPDLDPVV